ncbi:hypothetical protein HDV00_009294 [Rhizophlyctis rosea]|nr:hypothetical protein HDV00_009294 [Rhizophlyctis rosea]
MSRNIRILLLFLASLFTFFPPSTSAQGPGAPASSSPDMNGQQLAILEPLDGQHYLGPWLDLSEGHDTPENYNSRLGRNASFFHFAQSLPESSSQIPPFELLDHTATDAILYLSVLPTKGLKYVQQRDLQYIVDRCRQFNERGRKVFLRFAPGFNGAWKPYGQQPLDLITVWRALYNMLRDAKTANQTALVWSPFEGRGYPFPGEPFSAVNNTDNYKALDKDGDGSLTSKDDPYSPYWPGEQYVDWVGLAIYHRGNAFPWVENSIPNASYIPDIITGTLLPSLSNFYNTYAVNYKKPMMISETGAVHHLNADYSDTAGPDAVTIKKTWWGQFFNTTFMQTFPRLKMVCLYEIIDQGTDYEQGLWLDYQNANSSKMDVFTEFMNDLMTVDDGVVWAKPNGNATTWVKPEGSWGNGGGGKQDDNSRVTRVALATLVLLPLLVVGVLAGMAIRKRMRKKRREREAGLGGDVEGASRLHARGFSSGSESESGKGEVVEEEVDDSDTIINFEMAELGPGSPASRRTSADRPLSSVGVGGGGVASNRSSVDTRMGEAEVEEIDADRERRNASPWRDADPETRTL